MKLISAKYGKKYANQELILPEIGQVKFNEQGQIEVDDEKGDAVIDQTKDSLIMIKVEQLQNSTQAQISALQEELEQLKTPQLLELIKEANLDIPPAKLAAMSNKKLIELLIKSYREIERKAEEAQQQLQQQQSTNQLNNDKKKEVVVELPQVDNHSVGKDDSAQLGLLQQ